MGAEYRGFENPDEVREMPFGRADVIVIGGDEIMRLTLQPGWKWSEHVKPLAGTDSCAAPHFQYSISGTVHVVMDDGSEFDVGPGQVSKLPPGHDAWVVGDEPAVIVDWGGAHVWAVHE